MKKTHQETYEELTDEHSEMGRHIVWCNQYITQWQECREQDDLEPEDIAYIEKVIKRLCDKVAYWEGLRSMKTKEINLHLGVGRYGELPEEPIEVGQED